MPLNAQEFSYIQSLVRERSAIVLEQDKMYLVESRLTPVAREEGLSNLSELVTKLRAKPYNGLHVKVVEAMTTNETSFFRDLHPFNALREKLIPDLIQKRAGVRGINIWCAACSSGQEPFTIAMMLRETFPQLNSWKIDILATDLSLEILGRGKDGRYSQLEVNRGLPVAYLMKYFTKEGMEWRLKDEIRKMVRFAEMNLIGNWPVMPKMDLVFLRNVLIYFNVETKKSILGRARKVLAPDGGLFLGAAETTFNVDDAYQRNEVGKASYYTLKG